MEQNKIYLNKHPSDFNSGSIIKQISFNDEDNSGKQYLYIVCDNDGYKAGIYAVGLSLGREGSTWLSNTKVNWELIRGSLKE